MTLRTTRSTVTFLNPFVLGGYDEVLPAGEYDLEIDEELMGDLSFLAYRRIATMIHLPAKSERRLHSTTLTIDPAALEAALQRDAAATAAGRADGEAD